jgi:hypothetical protein
MQKAVQAPAAAQHVPVACVCFASGATQRTMRAGFVPQSALPNPSIERTNNGGSSFTAFAEAQPPLFASHLKR